MTDETKPPKIDARTMSEADFETANRARAWRNHQPQVKDAPPIATKPPTPMPAEIGPKLAMTMSDEEFEKANREKAWR